MIKTSVVELDIENQVEAHLWVDDRTGKCDIEINTAYEGITRKSVIKRLKTFLDECERQWDATP